jgi:hypothetical protein
LLNDRRIRIRIHTSDLWIRIQEAQKLVDPDPGFVSGSATLAFFNLAESGQQEGNAETEDLVMVQTPLSSLRSNNDVLVERVKDIEGKYNSILEMSEKLR